MVDKSHLFFGIFIKIQETMFYSLGVILFCQRVIPIMIMIVPDISIFANETTRKDDNI